MMMWGPGWGMGIWGWIWMIINWLFWIGILVGIAVLVVRLFQQPGGGSKGEDPRTILKRRYAAGQITREEFERMKQELRD